jgi:5'-3' exonuclease
MRIIMSKKFNDSMPKGNNLMIIDGFNLAFRYKHAKKRQFAAEYLQTVMSFANSYSATEVVVLSDGGSKFREEKYPNYKGDRKLLRATQSDEDKAEFADFLLDWQQAFELCGTQYHTIRYNGVEADDIAACLAIDPEIIQSFDHTWLISSDKDWDLLVSNKISRFTYRTRKEITLQNWSEHYNYTQEQHLSVKVLQGDKSDTIPGVAGIGEKRAATLVQQYGTAYDVYMALPINDKRVFMQNLNNFKEQILLNYELMDLPTYCWDAVGDHSADLKDKIGELLHNVR